MLDSCWYRARTEGFPFERDDPVAYGKGCGVDWKKPKNQLATKKTPNKTLAALIGRHQSFVNEQYWEENALFKMAQLIQFGGFMSCLWRKLIRFPVWKRG